MKNKTKLIQERWEEVSKLIQMGLGLEDDEREVMINILNEFATPELVTNIPPTPAREKLACPKHSRILIGKKKCVDCEREDGEAMGVSQWKEVDAIDYALEWVGSDKLQRQFVDPRDYAIFKHEKRIRELHSELEKVRQETETERKVTGETSDGYHTFNELYDFRKVFNATLFNEWYSQGKYEVHKSTRHSDGEDCFGGGWFIVMATLPTGQISNHYEMKDWNLFDCQVRQRADKWDGHTAKDVLDRLQAISAITKLPKDK